MYYTCQIYGQAVVSELELPALTKGEAAEDPVYIQSGRVSQELEGAVSGQSRFSVFNEHECLTNIP
ncbi:hypothetical protein D9M69_707140 [compost metagenome]